MPLQYDLVDLRLLMPGHLQEPFGVTDLPQPFDGATILAGGDELRLAVFHGRHGAGMFGPGRVHVGRGGVAGQAQRAQHPGGDTVFGQPGDDAAAPVQPLGGLLHRMAPRQFIPDRVRQLARALLFQPFAQGQHPVEPEGEVLHASDPPMRARTWPASWSSRFRVRSSPL